MTMLASWGVPPLDQLIENLNGLASSSAPAQAALDCIAAGESLHNTEQLALLAWLAGDCKSYLSIESGFGLGSTASVILSARHAAGRPFKHTVLDPFGLSGRGAEQVEKRLKESFGEAFERIRKRSQFGMASLAEESAKTDLIFVDGDHSFDGIMADFYVADKLVSNGGFITLDDAAFPAIESVIRFVMSNRVDYEVAHLEIHNMSVLRKVRKDQREWSHFEPFIVPQRSGWTV